MSSSTLEDEQREGSLPPSKFSDSSSSDDIVAMDLAGPTAHASDTSSGPVPGSASVQDMSSPPYPANGTRGGASQPSRSIAALLSDYQQMSTGPQNSPHRLANLLDGDPDPFRPSGPVMGPGHFSGQAQGAGSMYNYSAGTGFPFNAHFGYDAGMSYPPNSGLVSAPAVAGGFTPGYLVGSGPSQMTATPLIAQSIEEVDEPALSAPSSSYSLMSQMGRDDEENLRELRAMPAPLSGLLSEVGGTMASKPSSVLIHEDSLNSFPNTPQRNGWRAPEEARELEAVRSDSTHRLSSHTGSDEDPSSAPPGSEASGVFQYRLSHERQAAAEEREEKQQHLSLSTSHTDLLDISGMPSMQALMDGTIADLSPGNTPAFPQEGFQRFAEGDEEHESIAVFPSPQRGEDDEPPQSASPSTERRDRTSETETEDSAPTPMLTSKPLAELGSSHNTSSEGAILESTIAQSAPSLSPTGVKGWAGANEAHDILRRGSSVSQWHRSLTNTFRQSDLTTYSSHPGESRTTSRAWSQDESDVACSERDERERAPDHHLGHQAQSQSQTEATETATASIAASPRRGGELTWSPPIGATAATATARPARPPPVSDVRQPILGLGLGLTLGDESSGSRRPPPLRLRKWVGASPASKTAPLPLENDEQASGPGPTAQDDLSLRSDLDIESRLDDMLKFAATLPNGYRPVTSSSPPRDVGLSSSSPKHAHGPLPGSVSNATVTTSASASTLLPLRAPDAAQGDETEAHKGASGQTQYHTPVVEPETKHEQEVAPHKQRVSPMTEARPLLPWELSSLPPPPPGWVPPAPPLGWQGVMSLPPPPPGWPALGTSQQPGTSAPGTPATAYSPGSGPSMSQSSFPSPVTVTTTSDMGGRSSIALASWPRTDRAAPRRL